MNVHKNLEETNYWISVGDMMAVILAIFIFFFLAQIFVFNSNIKRLYRERVQYNLVTDKLLKERSQYKNIMKELDETRLKIIQKIKENIEINIDENTGIISLPSEILFASGKATLKPEGKAFLKEFVPEYLEVLLSDDEILKNLSQIVVEGHTDKQGSYLYNLNLSQRRALAVVEFMLTNEIKDFKGKELMHKYITANGRSYADFLGKPGQIIDAKSRRVEFKFTLKESDILEKLKTSVLINEMNERNR